MWISFVLVAITCAGCAFMIVFVVALLRENTRSASGWVIPWASGEHEQTAGTGFERELVPEDRSLESLHFMAEFGSRREDDFGGTKKNSLRPERIVAWWQTERKSGCKMRSSWH